MSDRMFTTTEVGKIMGVHFSTVGRWVDTGRLKGIITPSGHRRIREKDLVEFFKSKGTLVPEELQADEKMKVLIVEDNESVLNVLAEGLREAEDQFAVETATDGFEAGQIIERFLPDIVVLDIFLPTIDGFKVCRTIKSNYPKIKVIAITGKGSEEVEKKIMSAGADEYLEKPFDISMLPEMLKDILIKAPVGYE